MEESDLPKKTKVTLSFTVWKGYDEMIKIEKSQDVQDCLEFQRSRLTQLQYMLNALGRSWNYETEKTLCH